MTKNNQADFGGLRVVGFYGRSGSGKTALVERVLTELNARGLRVAVIKQSSMEAGLDTPGKDTWRFAQAGADAAVFQGAHQTVFFLQDTPALDDLLAWVAKMTHPDLVLVEGARDPRVPKVRLGDIVERPNTVLTYDGNFEGLIDFILKGEKK